uniref:Cytochrome P450 n=1 Tax=Scoparia dulcis TaxID=107240 RepID=A0A1W7HBV7_SCODU
MILVVVAAAILALAVLSFTRNKKKSLKPVHPPGPPGLPFIGNLHQFDISKPHIYLWQLSKKYGPIMLMKLGIKQVIVISSANIVKEVLKTQDQAFSGRPMVLGHQKLSYNGLDVAFAQYSDSWRELRKIYVVHLLSNKLVQSFRPVREDEIFSMIRNISRISSTGQVANLSQIMLSLTSSLICRIAFGKKCDEEALGKRRFDELMIESQAVQGGFFVSDYLPSFGWVDKISGMIDKVEKTYKDLDEFYQELIEEHLDATRPKSAHPDILDLLIQLKEEHSCSIDFTWDHIKAALMDIFIAGTDTGAVAIVWTITALIKNPSTMKKLQKEIRDMVGKKGHVNEEDLSNLPYLKAVIKEALGLYPPAPLLLPRETLQECTIGGYTIPNKALVYINAWAIARDPEYWESPEDFVPERFLNTNIDVVGKDFGVIPFGGGRRGCPGIAMGLATVELALANLLYSFDWELPSGMTKEDVETDVLPGLTMHKKNALQLVPKTYLCN